MMQRFDLMTVTLAIMAVVFAAATKVADNKPE